MKITDKIISIPPYISTSWDKISSLHMQGSELVITLRNETKVIIPALPSHVIEELFSAHSHFLDQQSQARITQKNPSEQVLNSPFRIIFGAVESLGQALQHNPAYKDLPPIPPEIVHKIELLAKAIPQEDIISLPNPEKDCNCIYCQISRYLKKHIGQEEAPTPAASEEETVSDEELQFEQWDVQPAGDKMYIVTNKLDPKEQYNVYLGDTIGCTCGVPNCEHIVAVLRH